MRDEVEVSKCPSRPRGLDALRAADAIEGVDDAVTERDGAERVAVREPVLRGQHPGARAARVLGAVEREVGARDVLVQLALALRVVDRTREQVLGPGDVGVAGASRAQVPGEPTFEQRARLGDPPRVQVLLAEHPQRQRRQPVVRRQAAVGDRQRLLQVRHAVRRVPEPALDVAEVEQRLDHLDVFGADE